MNFPEGYVINVDKPYKWTSTDVVRKIKFLLQRLGHKKIKIGHAGTLDPLATGVLLICIGKATKTVEKLQAQSKEYITEIVFGGTTPSFDLEHEVDETFPYEHITREALEQALEKLTGERLQTPPIYSAKRLEGKRAYELAREGKEVKVREALITVYSMEILDFALPKVTLKISCSKGTYIRSIAKELGDLLNSGAHLGSLRRTQSGDFRAEEGMQMEEIIKILELNETKSIL
ncbi:MAG: tRNA pseudouridine(55) synthase TruB [Rikenellaceae bacterium]